MKILLYTVLNFIGYSLAQPESMTKLLNSIRSLEVEAEDHQKLILNTIKTARRYGKLNYDSFDPFALYFKPNNNPKLLFQEVKEQLSLSDYVEFKSRIRNNLGSNQKASFRNNLDFSA